MKKVLLNNYCTLLITFLVYLYLLLWIIKSKKQILFLKHHEIPEQPGENIKPVRKRLGITTTQVAKRVGIAGNTLYLLEMDTSSVSMGAFFNVLKVLNRHKDFLKLASDDDLGRKLQVLNLLRED